MTTTKLRPHHPSFLKHHTATFHCRGHVGGIWDVCRCGRGRNKRPGQGRLAPKPGREDGGLVHRSKSMCYWHLVSEGTSYETYLGSREPINVPILWLVSAMASWRLIYLVAPKDGSRVNFNCLLQSCLTRTPRAARAGTAPAALYVPGGAPTRLAKTMYGRPLALANLPCFFLDPEGHTQRQKRRRKLLDWSKQV